MPDIQINDDLKNTLPIALETSAEVGELVKAITAARKNFGTIKKSAENPFYKDGRGKARMYADLAEMVLNTADQLADEGLYIFQALSIEGKTVGIVTRIIHTSSQWIQATITGCPADQKLKEGASRYDAQTIGIGFTYLARYAMRAILNLAAEDDDGNGLVKEPEQPKQFTARPVIENNNVPNSAGGFTTGVLLTNAKTFINETLDDCPVSDKDLPKDLQLPTPLQLTEFGKALKALGQDSRLLKQWVETEAGTSWKSIPLVKFTPIIGKLKAAEADGSLTSMITPK